MARGRNGQRPQWSQAEMAEAKIAKNKMAEDEVIRGLNDKRTVWQEDQVVNGRNGKGSNARVFSSF